MWAGGTFGPGAASQRAIRAVRYVGACGGASNSRLLVERYVALETLAPVVADEFVVKCDDVHDVAQILGWNLAVVVRQ